MKLETIVLDDYISVVEKDHVDKLIAMLNEYHSGNQRDILNADYNCRIVAIRSRNCGTEFYIKRSEENSCVFYIYAVVKTDTSHMATFWKQEDSMYRRIKYGHRESNSEYCFDDLYKEITSGVDGVYA